MILFEEIVQRKSRNTALNNSRTRLLKIVHRHKQNGEEEHQNRQNSNLGSLAVEVEEVAHSPRQHESCLKALWTI